MPDLSERAALDILKKKLDVNPNHVYWWDVTGSPLILHSAIECEFVLQAGTSFNTADKADPFQNWHRPWLHWLVLWIGLAMTAVCLVLVYGCQILLSSTTQTAVSMLYLIPPMVVPLWLMVFFWELNVQRDIPFWELCMFFLTGTILSLAGNALMNFLISGGNGSIAALREEPSKLMAGVLLLLYCSRCRKKEISGLTGLVIGAAIGSGFSAFESISYGLHSSFSTVLLRLVVAVVGHTLYSCSYTSAVALHSPGGRITWRSFCNWDFLVTFLCAVACHGLWNISTIPIWIRFPITGAVLWSAALLMVRKGLLQVRRGVDWQEPKTDSSLPDTISPDGNLGELRCLRGGIAGQKWDIVGDGDVTIGRSSGNTVQIPHGTTGVSRKHCRLRRTEEGWIIEDCFSSGGTFLQHPGERMYKLNAGHWYPISGGALIFLGSKEVCLSLTLLAGAAPRSIEADNKERKRKL